MRRISIFFCLFVTFITGIAAHADDVYNYAYTGSGVAGSGQVSLIGTDSDGVFQVTAIGGEVNGINITGLLPVNSYKDNDNLFYFSDTYLDANGVSFSLASGANVNIFYENGDWFFQGDSNFVLDGGGIQPEVAPRFAHFGVNDIGGDTTVALDSFTFSPAVAQTPEPSSLVLLGTGVLGVAGMAQRRWQRA
jgi:hypothetical protein